MLVHEVEPSAAAALAQAVEAAWPGEACGLLLGQRLEGCVRVDEVRPARNVEGSCPRQAFTVDPQAILDAELDAEARGLEVVGAFHSHVDAEAVPSAADVRGAPDGWTCLIVPVHGRADGPRSGPPRAYRPASPDGSRTLLEHPIVAGHARLDIAAARAAPTKKGQAP